MAPGLEGAPVSTIHRFWAGRQMPRAYSDYALDWADLNPGWSVKTWGEIDMIYDLPAGLQDVALDIVRRDGGRDGIEKYVQIADILGYWIVYEYGGVYVNCDMQPVRALPALPDKAWASLENDTERDIVNAAIGAPAPHDVFWGRVLELLPQWYFANPGAEMVLTTGPRLLTHAARTWPEEIHVFPRTVFNPVHWGQVPRGGDASAFLADLPGDTVAVHHWGHRRDGRTNIVEAATQ